MKNKLIGIDLGGTTTKFAFLNTKGDIIEKWSIPTDATENGVYIVPNIVESIQKKMSDMGFKKEEFIGIGMGSPGSVDRSQGTVVGAFNLNWRTVQPVREQIESSLNIPFYLDNDANVAALGEQWRGAGEDEANVVFITLGTGVGGGIIVDNQLVHGANDTAGEIGHMTVSDHRFNFACTCGKEGCLEALASATGISNIAKQMVQETELDSSLKQIFEKYNTIEAVDVFNQAKAGDQLAKDIVEIICDYLAFAAGNIANLLNPSSIIIGGGVSMAGNILKETVENKLMKYLFPPLRDKTKVKIAELQNDAGVIGAGSLVLNELKD